jgi:hypothetical protein
MTTRKLSFSIMLAVYTTVLSCNDSSSAGSSGVLPGTWIIEKSQAYSNVLGYAPVFDRYNRYKYLNLNPGGKGVLWGGTSALDGQATWNESLKIVELKARDSVGVFLDFEKFDIDSLSAFYLHLIHFSYRHDTTLTQEFFLRK